MGRCPPFATLLAPLTAARTIAAPAMATMAVVALAIVALAIAAAAPIGGAPARAQSPTPPLVSDLSSHRISITSSFTGTELLLFGAIARKGDVIVVVRGPDTTAVVRRKERRAGIWVNADSVVVDHVPGYYALAANRQIQQIASHGLLARLQIGAENLRFQPRAIDPVEFPPFREALIRNKLRNELYLEEVGSVTFLGDTLFSTRLRFPASVPVGIYTAQIFLLQDDEVLAAQTTPLVIGKTGLERAIYDFAHQQPALYGLAAIVVALFSGWLAAALFRKG